MELTPAPRPGPLASIARWFDSSVSVDAGAANSRTIDWTRVVPFFGLHAACFAALWVGVSSTAIFAAAALYAVRMFAITGFYHRYFSHRAFQTSRTVQFLFALVGSSSAQRGPLWWVSHHRHHHAHADEASDPHSVRQHGFFWSHLGWFMTRESFPIRPGVVDDFERYPELRFLDRYDIVPSIVLGILLFALGEALAAYAPTLHTSGGQLVIWGYCISTVVLYHATFTINSLAHSFGRRRYATRDDSRNNAWLALLTFGEGWHNNHHHFPGSARQGFYWWEIDLTYYGLRLLAALGLIWGLKAVPPAVLRARRVA